MKALLTYANGEVESLDVTEQMLRSGHLQMADPKDRDVTPGSLQVGVKHVRILTFKLRSIYQEGPVWDWRGRRLAIFDEVVTRGRP